MQDIEIAEKKAHTVVQKLKDISFTLAVAESCTAGLIAALLANTSGASSVLWGSYVCYAQKAKVSMLDIDNKELETFGLVSGETALRMAKMALQKSGADITVSVTGLAGPDSLPSASMNNSHPESFAPAGSHVVPVGTVWIAAGLRDGDITARKFHFNGNRNEVRLKAAIAALEAVLESLPGG